MDPEISSWVLEWLLRNRASDSLVEECLKILPTSNCGSQVQKLLCLRHIRVEVSQGLVTEKILENLERIQEIDRIEGISVTQKMKDAYCAVAVECTLKFLVSFPQMDPEYIKAVDRIWRDKFVQMEPSDKHSFFSNELNNWKNKIELSLHDTQMLKTLCNMIGITPATAFKKVVFYLEEAFGLMGPSFLETLKATSGKSESDKVTGFVSEAEPTTMTEGRPHSQEFDREGPSNPEKTVNKDDKRLASQEPGRDGSHAEEEKETRIHLPDTKRLKVSPLKKYDEKKLTIRRASKKWSAIEEQTLRAGVKKFGEGYWKIILTHYPDVFKDRNEVDLKDKWRNIKKYGHETI